MQNFLQKSRVVPEWEQEKERDRKRERERERTIVSVKSALETWAKSTKYVLCACTMFELKKKWNLRIYVYFESKKRMRKGGERG